MVEKSGDEGMEVVDLRFESLRDLQDDFGPFLSSEGFFLSGRSDFEVSDVLRFRLMLPGDFVLIEGLGVVVWVRNEPEGKAPPGAAVGFATLSDQGRELVERIVQSHVGGGGKAFDMSSRAENGDANASQPDQRQAPESPAKSSAMKFTVRDELKSDSSDAVVDVDADQRLPFEADVEPELLELEVVESVSGVADSPASELFEAVSEESPSSEPIEEQRLQSHDQSDASSQVIFAEESVESVEPEPEQEPEPKLRFEPELKPEPEALRAIAESTFEVSLPDREDQKPDHRLWTDSDVELASGEPERPNRRAGLIWVLGAVVILVGGGWLVWTQFPEVLPWNQPNSSGVPTVVEGGDQDIVPSEEIPALSDEDVEAAVAAAVDAVTGAENVEETEPDVHPTEAPVAVSPVSGPASKIVEIKTEETGDGTVVLIRGDGVVDRARISTSELANPPRVLIRISGIDGPFRPYVIPVGNSILREIRIGYHEETRPPSLWIVLDRADGGVGVRDVQSSGNLVRVDVGR